MRQWITSIDVIVLLISCGMKSRRCFARLNATGKGADVALYWVVLFDLAKRRPEEVNIEQI